jgi:hypothetical protein
LPTAAYQAAADTMSLAELVEFAEVSVTVSPDSLHSSLVRSHLFSLLRRPLP